MQETPVNRPYSMVKHRRNLLSVKSNRPTTHSFLNESTIQNNKFTNDEPIVGVDKDNITDGNTEVLIQAKEHAFSRVRGSANPIGIRYPVESMLKGATNASTNLESRPQTGNTTTVNGGGKASKAHSAVYRDNCANSNLLNNKRNNALVVNSNEFYAKNQVNPLTVSHKSIGGGIMSKKKRDRNEKMLLKDSGARMHNIFEDYSAIHDEVVVESRTYINEVMSSNNSASKTPKLIGSSYYKGNAIAKSPEIESYKDYGDILYD